MSDKCPTNYDQSERKGAGSVCFLFLGKNSE